MRVGQNGIDVVKEEHIAAGELRAEIHLHAAAGRIRRTTFEAGRRVIGRQFVLHSGNNDFVNERVGRPFLREGECGCVVFPAGNDERDA